MRRATLAERIDDLDAVLDALDVAGPVVVAGHDWGGAVVAGLGGAGTATGFAAVVLANTAVHQPAGSPAPALIRLARTPALRHAVCAATPLFVRAATALSRPAAARAVRDAFAAPYGSAARRRAVEEFVADIPLEPGAPQRGDAGRDRRGGPQARRRAGAAAVGPARPGVLRPLPARPAGPPAARGRAALREASHLVLEDAPEAAGHAWAWIT